VFGALFDELGQLGFIEGENLIVDPRGFGLAVRDLEVTALEVTAQKPDAIYSGGAVAGRAVKKATKTIPVVVASDDMTGDGIVKSFARPDGNITGISILAPELDDKRLGLLMEVTPGVHHVAALVDPATTLPSQLEALVKIAHSRGVELSIHRAASVGEIGEAVASAQAVNAEAFTVLTSALFHAHRLELIKRIDDTRLPAIYQWPEYCAEGALIAYGPRFTSMYRQAARMLVKILKGAKPADMPVEQPTQLELGINLKVAKELGLAIPVTLRLTADEVIE
jgi:putative ABC transport system substrate-binding protein